jgi:hypothetical protein
MQVESTNRCGACACVSVSPIELRRPFSYDLPLPLSCEGDSDRHALLNAQARTATTVVLRFSLDYALLRDKHLPHLAAAPRSYRGEPRHVVRAPSRTRLKKMHTCFLTTRPETTWLYF